jgi:hypothetical protein
MATEVNIGSYYTLVDLMKTGFADNGRAIFVAQTLARKNPIVKEVPIIEANQALSHVGGRQLALPTVGKRAINEGVVIAAHKEVPVTAPMSLFETASQIDIELLKLAGGGPAADVLRQRKDAAFIEAMAQAVADEIINGSIGDDALGFNGLATMFNSSTTYPNGESTWFYNVQLAGGSSSALASIYVCEWGVDKMHLIYPKNTMGGLEITDRGEQWVAGSAATKKFWAKVTQFVWRCGLFVADERCCQRIANIEKSGNDYLFDENLLITALNRLPDSGENPATRIYVNRTVKTQMEIRVKDKNNMFVTNFADAFGVPVLRFRGVPVQVLDTLNTDETAIS